VLGAGAATRFGGDKLAALLAGRPVVDHVLDALEAVPLAEIVLVTRAGGFRTTEPRAGLTVVVNRSPARGISSSLQVGLDAAEALSGDPVDGILVALGDQPLLDPATVRALIGAASPGGPPVLVPRREPGGPRNPVLVLRSAFGLVRAARGDRGLGPLLDAAPDLVTVIDAASTAGADVDTPADLARIEADLRQRPGR